MARFQPGRLEGSHYYGDHDYSLGAYALYRRPQFGCCFPGSERFNNHFEQSCNHFGQSVHRLAETSGSVAEAPMQSIHRTIAKVSFDTLLSL